MVNLRTINAEEKNCELRDTSTLLSLFKVSHSQVSKAKKKENGFPTEHSSSNLKFVIRTLIEEINALIVEEHEFKFEMNWKRLQNLVSRDDQNFFARVKIGNFSTNTALKNVNFPIEISMEHVQPVHTKNFADSHFSESFYYKNFDARVWMSHFAIKFSPTIVKPSIEVLMGKTKPVVM